MMTELRSNTCHIKKMQINIKGPNIILNQRTHRLDQKAKSNICCVQQISDPSNGGGFKRDKSGNGETSQNTTTVCPQEWWWNIDLRQRVDFRNHEDLKTEGFYVTHRMWYGERRRVPPRFLMGSPSTEMGSIDWIRMLKRKMVHLSCTSWAGWVYGLPK